MPLVLLIAGWESLALGAVAVLVKVTIGWGHEHWASDQAEGNVKTIQAIVLGLGFLGVVAGAVVTYRRQQTMQDQLDHDRERLSHERRNDQARLDEDRRKYQLELDKFAQEQAKYAQEQVRETERRQQERYAQGAQLLADESPAVRIAGLNVIAALGREVAPEQELRQTCGNLVCAYLRASSPAAPQPAQEGGQKGSLPEDLYRVVAAEACRLLPTLLEEIFSSGDHNLAPPRGLDLDIRQVNLIDLNLGHRRLGTVRCDLAKFTGDTSFFGAIFTGRAVFYGATFAGNAVFSGVSFAGHALFLKARFTGNTWFDMARFTGKALFLHASFAGNALFGGATFGKTAVFAGVTITEDADFHGATFNQDADFDGATFTAARFDKATFMKCGGRDALGAAEFGTSEPFGGAVFLGQPSLWTEQPNDKGEEDVSSLM